MRFWDSSAIVPLLLTESDSARLDALVRDDPAIAIWWATPVECASALSRLERDGKLAGPDLQLALERLRQGAAHWAEVPPSERVREQALRLLRIHNLRTADALQLAAALVTSDFQPGSLELVTLDQRLAAAADREGFALVSP
jgi:predicted nucleic acid-binding protein